MRRVAAKFSGATSGDIRRVISSADLLEQDQILQLRFAVKYAGAETEMSATGGHTHAYIHGADVQVGDVILCEPQRNLATILYRESDRHHSLFLTNRCNSNCLMCSQPPTKNEDGWLVEQAIEVVRHIAAPPVTIGITGGEPTLLGEDLVRVAESIRTIHPRTGIEVLTNGRLLGEASFADPLLMKMPAGVGWLVPLYGHADFLHDFVVQAPGAFDETVAGLLNLRRHEQLIQLRIVLIRPVLENLDAICRFVARNLPFVDEVALMGCEPVGFAIANQDLCRVDLCRWHEVLLDATATLQRAAVRFNFMNTPMCSLPEALWERALRSISDWKNVYAKECSGCAVKADCCGLFAWHQTGWAPSSIRAIERRVA